jgi:hypothetical protein
MPKSPPLATLDMVLRTPEALASLLSHLVLVSDSPEPHLPATRDLALFFLLILSYLIFNLCILFAELRPHVQSRTVAAHSWQGARHSRHRHTTFAAQPALGSHTTRFNPRRA